MAEIPFDYNKIDTSLIVGYSDEKLLRQMKAVNWVEKGGHGLIAEVCKRLESYSKEVKL